MADESTENKTETASEQEPAEIRTLFGVAQTLRDAREKRDLSVQDVADKTRISSRYISAIEEGRQKDLPVTAYAVGFVRTYAKFLDLDAEEIVRRYKDEADGLKNKQDLVFPKPIPEGGLPGGVVLGAGLLLAVLAYGVWYSMSGSADDVAQDVPPVPEPLAQIAPAPEPTVQPLADQVEETAESVVESVDAEVTAQADIAADQAASTLDAEGTQAVEAEVAAEDAAEDARQAVQDTVADTLVNEQVTDAPTQPEVVNGAVVDAVTPDSPPEPEPEPEAQPQPAPEPAPVAAPVAPKPKPVVDAPSRITIRARANSWVQIRDEAENRTLLTRLLRADEEYQVPGQSGLVLQAGNAGALEILVDGEAVPPLGDSGAVMQRVLMDPDRLKAGTATEAE